MGIFSPLLHHLSDLAVSVMATARADLTSCARCVRSAIQGGIWIESVAAETHYAGYDCVKCGETVLWARSAGAASGGDSGC